MERDFWDMIHRYDFPNWLVAIVWPTVTFLFIKYVKRRGVKGLEIRPRKDYREPNIDLLNLQFTNKSGSRIYISNASFFPNKKRLPMPPPSHPDTPVRDPRTGGYELKFREQPNASYASFYALLEPEHSTDTIMWVGRLDDEVLGYNPARWRKWLYCHMYYKIKYTAQVGEKFYKVSSAY